MNSLKLAIVGFILLLAVACTQADEEREVRIVNMDECPSMEAPKSALPDIVELSNKAETWLRSMSQDQKTSAQYCLGDAEMYTWSNLPPPRSGGIALAELEDSQQTLAWDVLKGFLSEDGFKRIHYLSTAIEDASGAGPIDAYTFGVFGKPSQDGAWGFQFDGHHVALNFMVHASDVVLAPAFIGTQPHAVAGYMPMAPEYQLGRELVEQLTPGERDLAYVDDLVRRDVLVGAGRRHLDTNRSYDYTVFDGMGLPISDLNSNGTKLVKELLANYINYLKEPYSEKLLSHLIDHVADGWFVFSTRGDRMYYRVYIPNHIWIEYSDVRSDHIHTITRLIGQPPYRDYGYMAASSLMPSTLGEHYQLAAHHQ